MKYLIILLIALLTGCLSDPAPVCTTQVTDICFISNSDGVQTCGYPTIEVCAARLTVLGGYCYPKTEEICQ